MDVSFLQGATNTTGGTTVTFSSQSLGTADADRYIVVCAQARGVGTLTLDTITVAGVTATIVANITNLASNSDMAAVAIAAVPSGTSGDVAVTFSGGVLRAAIQMYRLVGIDSPTPADTATDTAADPSVSLDVPAGGVGIGGAFTANAVTCTWTGLTEDFDQTVSIGNATSAHEVFVGAQSGLTITADFSSPSTSAGAFASWAPAASGSSVSAAAAVTIGGVSASASATHTAPSFTASAAPTIGGIQASAAATHTAPTFAATAAATIGGATSAASASFAASIHQATAAPSIGGATAAASASFTAPSFTATAAPTVGGATATVSASHTAPSFTATAAPSVGGAEVAISSTFATSLHTAIVAAEIGGVTVSVSSTFEADPFEVYEDARSVGRTFDSRQTAARIFDSRAPAR